MGEDGLSPLKHLLYILYISGVRRCLQKSSLADVIIVKLFFIKVSVNLQLNFDLHIGFLSYQTVTERLLYCAKTKGITSSSSPTFSALGTH